MNTNRRGFFGTCAAAATWLIGHEASQEMARATCVNVALGRRGVLWDVEIEYSDSSWVRFTTKRVPSPERCQAMIGQPKSTFIGVT